MKRRVYVDREHKVMMYFYDLCEICDSETAKFVKKELRKLIEKDPNFLDSYLFLYEILMDEGSGEGVEELLNEAYERAIKLITDEEGEWPDVLSWDILENRHIIRAIVNKALCEWDKGGEDTSLHLFQKLLKTDPWDGAGIKFYILAIKMYLSFDEFENRFNKGGYYDEELHTWFEENYHKFPDEFTQWQKEIGRLTNHTMYYIYACFL